MTQSTSWADLAEGFEQLRHRPEPLWAVWHAYEGSEDHGIWHLRPGGADTDEVRAIFSLIAARAIEILGIQPSPIPQPLQFCPHWREYCEVEEQLAHRAGREIDLSDAVPYGLAKMDADAIDPCSRSWLELLRRESTAFDPGSGTEVIGGRRCETLNGEIRDVCGASAVYCLRCARDEIRDRLVKPQQTASPPSETTRPLETAEDIRGRRKISEYTSKQIALADTRVNTQEDVYTETASHWLRCSVQHVRRLIRNGKLEALNTKPKRIMTASLKLYRSSLMVKKGPPP